MRFGTFAFSLLLVAAGAQADTRAHQEEELARFQQYAGPPVEQFTMYDLWKWQGLGPRDIAVWTTINDAYLIRVEKSCNNLDWTHGLSLTQKMRQQVTQKFDYVVLGSQHCKIEEIRPVDYRAMLKAGENGPAR
jgi:hypothetical protein